MKSAFVTLTVAGGVSPGAPRPTRASAGRCLLILLRTSDSDGLSAGPLRDHWAILPRQTSDSFVTGSFASYADQKPAVRNSFDRFFSQLRDLRSLGNDWDSYGAPAPNGMALAQAEEVLHQLVELGMQPASVRACADGGVTVAFARGVVTALVECFNDGEIVSGVSRGPGQTTVCSVEPGVRNLRLALEEIRDHIERCNSGSNAKTRQADQQLLQSPREASPPV